MPTDERPDGGRGSDRFGGEVAVRHRWTGQEVGTAVAQAVAAATDTEVTDMAPLAYSVDTDALGGLVADGHGGSLSVSFSYEGTDVRVDSDGEIFVRLPPEDG